MTTDLVVQETTERDIAVANRKDAAGALAHVLGTGDLYKLTNEQRVAHYINLCKSLDLNPLSRPFQWIEFKEGDSPPVLTLYFKPSGAAQMLRNHHVSVHYPRKEIVGELFVCEAHGQAPDGRKGVGTKYVSLTNKYGKLSGNRLANAFMSAESGALRRLALNMFGLSAGPETDENASVRTVYVDGTGKVLQEPTEEQRYLAETPTAARAIGEPTYESTAAAWPSDAEQDDELPDQRMRADEIEQSKRSGPPPSFVNSEETIKGWLGAWFATVKGLSLDSDDARHAFVAQWTAEEWPKAKRTESLRTAFARMTPSEAGDFLGHVRALMDGERRELLAFTDEAALGGRSGDKVRDSVALTGGPSAAESEEPAF